MSTSNQGPPPPPAQRGRRRVDDVVSTAETIARFVAEGVSGSGVKGLEGPAKTLLGIISHFKRIRDNSATCQDVAAQIGALTETLKAATDTVRAQVAAQALPATLIDAQLGSSAELTSRIAQLQQRLDQVGSSAATLRKQDGLKRFALANRNTDILKGICDNLRRAREDFMLTGQLAIEIALGEVAAEVRANSVRNQAAELSTALEKLPYADAGYRASIHARHGRLLAGTRDALLKDLDSWVAAEADSQNERPFYVLSGGAGTGKSTIAFELARRAEQAGHLGASFFFMRGSALLNSTEVFFPTLARQLILNVSTLQAKAVAVIQKHLKHGTRQNMDSQARDLFTELLSGLPPDHHPIVIVVDAVDECTESAQDLVPRMLFLMMNALSEISCRVRVFVTSRPEVHIEDAFQSVAFTSAQKFILHEVPRPIIDSDIRLYCQSALAEMPDASRTALFISYPDAPDDLTDLAAGLFIYATTAIEFLKQYRTAIVQGMDHLALTGRGKLTTSLQRLDELYVLVLQTAFPPNLLSEKRDCIKTLLGHVAVLQDHISPSDLAILTGTSLYNDLLPILDRLGAVLSFEAGNPDAPMRPLHASFGEFLIDAARCTDIEFHVNSFQHHFALANSCLTTIMRPGALIRNVCRLSDPSVPRDVVDDLSVRVKKYLPVPIQYSCAHWVVHLALCGGDRRISIRLSDFCHTRLLEWIEAVVFVDALDRVVHWLPILHRLISPSDIPEDDKMLLYDIWRVALEFSPAIKACPQQLYLSAIPLLPSSSKLKAASMGSGLGTPAFYSSHEAMQEWTLWHDIQPSGSQGMGAAGFSFAVFAPHGRWIALSGSTDGAVYLCNPETGAILLTVPAHVSEAHHLSISSNGLRLVSTSADRVCVISTRSGAILHQLDWISDDSTGFMASFFIRGGRAILTAWQTGDGTELHIWEPPTNHITELRLSGVHGQLLRHISVSSRGDWAIAVYPSEDADDPFTGCVIDLASATVAYTLPLSTGTACFAADTDVAVIPLNGFLSMYNVSSAQIVRDLEVETEHVQIVISPDGATVVGLGPSEDGSPQHTIDILSATGQRQLLPVGTLLECISFSPDGSSVLGVPHSGDCWRMIALNQQATLPSTDSATAMLSRPGGNVSSAIGISPDLSIIAIVVAGTLRVLQSSGTVLTSVSLPTNMGEWGTDPHVGLTFSHQQCFVVVTNRHSMCVCDISGQGAEVRCYQIPDEAMRVDLRRRQFGGNIDEQTLEFEFEFATFTPDDSAIVALTQAIVRTEGGFGTSHYLGLYAAQWELSSADPRRVCILSASLGVSPWNSIPGELGWFKGVHVDQDWNLHLSVCDQYGHMRVYSISQSEWDRENHEVDASVSLSENMTDQLFALTVDGWITHASSKRRVCWLPASRRPSPHNFRSQMATRGHMVATMTDTGLLTVLNLAQN